MTPIRTHGIAREAATGRFAEHSGTRPAQGNLISVVDFDQSDTSADTLIEAEAPEQWGGMSAEDAAEFFADPTNQRTAW